MIEAKGSCIAWNYRKVASQILLQEMAMELTSFLDPKTGLMAGYPVQVVSGKGYVEVKRNDIDKGKAVERVLAQLGRIDFVLCIGDDRSDEDMFEVINGIADKALTQPRNSMTTTISAYRRLLPA